MIPGERRELRVDQPAQAQRTRHRAEQRPDVRRAKRAGIASDLVRLGLHHHSLTAPERLRATIVEARKLTTSVIRNSASPRRHQRRDPHLGRVAVVTQGDQRRDGVGALLQDVRLDREDPAR